MRKYRVAVCANCQNPRAKIEALGCCRRCYKIIQRRRWKENGGQRCNQPRVDGVVTGHAVFVERNGVCVATLHDAVAEREERLRRVAWYHWQAHYSPARRLDFAALPPEGYPPMPLDDCPETARLALAQEQAQRATQGQRPVFLRLDGRDDCEQAA
jgi:hypothetical protein